MKKVLSKIDSFFKITEKGSTIGRELIAGVIIFLAMVYILPVNSGMLSEIPGLSYGAVFFATAVASGIATILMGLLANYPVALSAGMGLNALMTYTVCLGMGYTWQEALCVIFVSGIIFLIISLTGLRKKVISAIPKDLKYAIGAGIGAFIAIVGLSNAGIVITGDTILQLGEATPSFFLALGGIFLVFVLHSLPPKISRFSVILSIIIVTVVGFILGLCGVEGMPTFQQDIQLNTDAVGGFIEGFSVFAKPSSYAILFTFLFVDFFDTSGTLVAVGTTAGLVDEETGELKGDKSALLADAVGTVVGATLGTSTITSFIESSTGVESGARTGLSAVVVGLLFFASLLIFPAFTIFANSSATTTMALVLVGALMFSNLKNINWNDKVIVVSSFITVLMMVFCYSISEGLSLGFIVYVVMMLASKRGKEVNPVMYVLSGLFLVNFIVKFFVL